MKRNQVTSESRCNEPRVKKKIYIYNNQVLTTVDLLKKNVSFKNTDIDDFIVDDDGRPLASGRSKKFSGYTDA